VVQHACICCINTGASPSVRPLMVEWRLMIKEVVNVRRQAAIIHGNLAHFLPI
jgi:hypothetical protein